jgi:ClpP class serine protease
MGTMHQLRLRYGRHTSGAGESGAGELMTRHDQAKGLRYVKPGELLAMSQNALHQGPGAFFWLQCGGAIPSERRGDVAIVHVRDALEHHESPDSDSYESILKRVRLAMSGEDAEPHDEDESLAFEAKPPSVVILCIDSPGGVVSGLNETVYALRRMSQETGVPLVAYVNELAASAAFALCCACSKVLCPPSAIVGSIGVISTMISQSERDKKDGFDVRLLTSGARKADGHIHAPITDAAVNAEMSRVEKLATTFFKIASKARKIPTDRIESFQAGIFLGSDAFRRGLVDEVLTLDDAVLALSRADNDGIEAGGNVTDRRASRSGNRNASHKALDATRCSALLDVAQVGPKGAPMLALQALIKKTKAAIAKEKDVAKVRSLTEALVAYSAAYKAYKKTEKHVEHVKTEEGQDDDDDEEDDDSDDKKKDDEDDDSEESEEAEEKASHSAEEEEEAPPMKNSEKAEEEEEAEEAEEKKATAALRLLEQVTGQRGNAAIGAAMAKFATADRVAADVAKLKADAQATERTALLKTAAKYVPKHLLGALKTQKLSALRAFVAEAKKGQPMVATEEGDLIVPKAVVPGSEESLPKETLAMIDQAVAACGLRDPKAFREQLVAKHTASHSDRLNKALNGAGRL